MASTDEQICGEDDANYTHAVIQAIALSRGGSVYSRAPTVHVVEVEEPRVSLLTLLTNIDHADEREAIERAYRAEAAERAARADLRARGY